MRHMQYNMHTYMYIGLLIPYSPGQITRNTSIA